MSQPRLIPGTDNPGRVEFELGSEQLELSLSDFDELSKAQEVVEKLVGKARMVKAQLQRRDGANAA